MKIVENTLKKWKILFLLCNWFHFIFVISFQIELGECHIAEPLDHSKFMNENSTFFHPSTVINATQIPIANTTISLLDADELKKFPWWCSCSSELEELVVNN